MSDLDLFADLVTRKLISSDGGAVTLPTFVLGDTLRCTLRTMERFEGGDLRERDLRVRTLRASIGKVLASPIVGWFKLWIGDFDTPQTISTPTPMRSRRRRRGKRERGGKGSVNNS